MSPTDLTHFLTILAIALVALVAAPTLAFLFEREPEPRTRERDREAPRGALAPT